MGAAKRTTGLLAVLVGAAALSCIPDGPVKIPYNDQPVQRADGWLVASPESQGFDAAKLREAYELFFSEDDFVPSVSLLVVRNGTLVAEGYCRDREDWDRKGAIMSVTKSVTSLLFGIAWSEGLFSGVGEALSSVLPDEFDGDEKKSITLRHLLTMRSGIDFTNDDFSMEMEWEVRGDGIRHILGKPLASEPGERFSYRDCDPHLLSAAIGRRAGTSLEKYADSKLFEPLGIRDYRWLRHRDGTTYGPFGLYLRPRDLAKLGQLALSRGMWKDRRIVPALWVGISTQKQSDLDEAGAALGLEYGYLWWIVPELGAYTAVGHGGQYLFVVPAKSLVIVHTAEPDTSGGRAEIEIDEFLVLARMIVGAAL